ncbi:MAG: orotidine-5'-phosphate decarboxylase [Bryobacteraceae bacterium]|nr:orotidine-5'-phosphate decarboxylase [Bryobacteraceae bacterium]
MGEVNPVIVALDVASASEAREMVARLGPAGTFYKVGLELYAAAGMEFVRELLAQGKQVFLDLKLYDIGETVKRAAAQIAAVEGIRFLTVHGHPSVMRAAVEGRGNSPLKILAVTVLTSWTGADLAIDGHSGTVAELVERRVANAHTCGVDGLICSPLEVARVREMAGPGAILVTPGVRSAGADVGDQKRVATPEEAMRNGANYLVIGRQITRAQDPAAEMRRVLAALQS